MTTGSRQFKLDENLPKSLVAEFESAGYDARPVPGQGLQGKSDVMVARVRRAEDRVFVTLDSGFADIRAYPPHEHAGIVVLRVRDQSVPYVRAVVQRLLRLLASHPMEKTLCIVEDGRVRFRE